jgi:hypothetical protein
MPHYYIDRHTTVMAIIVITCAVSYILFLIYVWIRRSLQERKLKRTAFDAEIDLIDEKILKKRKERQLPREFSSVDKLKNEQDTK